MEFVLLIFFGLPVLLIVFCVGFACRYRKKKAANEALPPEQRQSAKGLLTLAIVCGVVGGLLAIFMTVVFIVFMVGLSHM